MRVRSFPRILLVLSAAALALPAGGATFHWKGASAGASWSDLSSWSTEGATGADASSLPTEADDISTTYSLAADLGGQTREINGWPNSFGATLENGTLVAHGGVAPEAQSTTYTLRSGTTLRFAAGSSWQLSNQSRSQMTTVNLESGSTLDFNGGIYIYRAKINVASGATARFNWTRFGANNGTNQKDSGLFNSGTVELPNGMVWASGGWSANNFDFTLRNNPGATLLVGGSFSKGQADGSGNNKHVVFKVDIAGGTVHATNSVAFDADSLAVTGSSEWNVDAARTVDLSPFTVSSGVGIAKSGAGRLVLPDVPGALDIQAGTAAVDAADRTIGTLTDNRGVLAISKPGLSVSSVAAGATLSGSVTVDLSDFNPGDIVVATPDATLRAQVRAAAEAAAAGTGVVIEEDGNAIRVGVPADSYVFSSTTVRDLSNAAGWSGGVLPPAGADVFVVGSGVVGTLNDSAPVWNSIAATGGATLRLAVAPDAATAVSVAPDSSLVIAAGATVPSVYGAADTTFEPGSGLSVPSGGTFDLSDGVVFRTTSASDLPTITVPATATLRVPGGYGFRNVRLVLDGALEATGDGTIAFGTAAAGETAWFAMEANGATVTAKNAAGTDNGSQIRFACPEDGGTVVVASPILLADCTFAYTGHDGFAFGRNNHEGETFTVVATGTVFPMGWTTVVGGGCTLRLGGGSLLVRQRHSEGDGGPRFNLEVVDRGTIELADGGEIRSGVTIVNGNLTDSVVRLDPSEAGRPCIKVLDGGVACWYKLNGYDRGSMVVSNGVVEIFKSYWWGWGNRNHVFNRLTGVEIPAGATMTLKGVKDKLSTNDPRLTFFELEAPFTGGGDLLVTNALPSSNNSGSLFRPEIVRGDNTCTGSLEVADSPTYRTTLLFMDGANWAGTVNWNSNRMSMVYSNSSSPAVSEAPQAVSFGGVRMDTDFALRIWEDGTADSVSIGAFGWSGTGKVALERQGGFEVRAGDRWAIGTQPASLPPPKSADPAFVIRAEDIDGDDARVRLVAVVPKGIVILLQ